MIDEDALVEFLLQQLIENSVEFATGVPLNPVSAFLRFVDWLDDGNPHHIEASKKAISKYRKSGFCSDFRSDFRDGFK